MNAYFNSLPTSAFYFKEQLQSSLTPQQKKILVVATLALSCIVVFSLFCKCCFKAKEKSQVDLDGTGKKADDQKNKIEPNVYEFEGKEYPITPELLAARKRHREARHELQHDTHGNFARLRDELERDQENGVFDRMRSEMEEDRDGTFARLRGELERDEENGVFDRMRNEMEEDRDGTFAKLRRELDFVSK